MGKRVRLGPVSEVASGDFRLYHLNAIDVVVYNVDGSYFAVSNYCPHLGVAISRGPLDGQTITCPGHGYRFDVTTGACLDVPELSLARFTLEVEDGTLYVSF